MRAAFLIGVFLFGFMAAAEAAPDKRVALVIGNNAYKELHALGNPGADAESLAKILSERGFDVISCDGKRPGCFDLTHEGLSAAIGQLKAKSQDAGLAFVFYAGHGMEAAEGNVLAPIDADIDCERQQVARGVLVDEVLEALAGAKQKIVVLDACRNNPLGEICPPATKAKLTFRDFKVPDAGNFLLVSSTKPGQVADDGLAGAHSPFARALLAALSGTPNVHFDQVFNRVSKAVIEETSKGNFTQIPEMLIRGGAPETCLAGEACAADPRAAALAEELEALKRDRARDQELGETAKEYLAQVEKQHGKPLTEEERHVELASLREATRSLAARNDNRGERALNKLKTGDTGEAEKLFQEDLDAAEAERKAETQRLVERSKKAAASAKNIAALARWKDVAKALTYYKRAVDLDPDDADSWIAYAGAAEDSGHTDEAKAAYAQAEAKAGNEPAGDIRYRIAQGRGSIASAQGNLTGALSFYRSAREEAEQRLAREPESEEWQSNLREATTRIGRVYSQQSDSQAALESYREALKIAERLANASPNNPKWQRLLSAAYGNVGDALLHRSELAQSVEAYRNALAIAERLVKSNPDNTLGQVGLLTAYNDLGYALEWQGDLESSLKLFRDALEIGERLAKADPANVFRQSNLAHSYSKVAGVLDNRGELDQAVELYQIALAIRQRLAKADPNNANSQGRAALAASQLAIALTSQGKLAQALQVYRDELAIVDRLVKADPTDTVWRGSKMAVLLAIGNVLAAQGDFAQALDIYRSGLEIAERTANEDPRNTSWQDYVATNHLFVGEALEKQGNLSEALKAFKNALAIQDRLVKADPGRSDWQGSLAYSYLMVGDILKAQQNAPQAMKSFQESLAIRERLANSDPKNAQWQSNLGVSHERVGDAFLLEDNLPEARNSYQKSLAIVERLVQASPSNAGRQHDLAVEHYKLAQVLVRQGEEAAARDALGKAKEIMARAVAMSPDNQEWKRNLAYYEDVLANFPSWQGRFEVEAAFKRGDYAKAAAAQAKLTALLENARLGQGGKPGKETADAFLELGWYRLFARDFRGALAASERGIAIQPDMFSLATNKAHALMFLGRARAARALYLLYKGQTLKDNGKLWERTVLDDFKEFEERGLKHPQMAEIEALLTAK